ncbi:MAG: HlyD family efflux transporter periplasmic adaptor subunit [bacterium]
MIAIFKQPPKEIIIPFDGVLTKISIKNGAIVSRGNELVTLVNPKDICGALKVSGENISKVKEGQGVIIKKEYYSTYSMAGKIEEISMISEEDSSSEGEGKDYFKVRAKLAQPIGGELINKVIYGEIILKEKSDAITVDFEAIRYEEDGSPYVFLYKEGKAKKQKIGIGLKGEECVEIIEGVNLQDKIIIQEDLPLIDGQRIKVQDKSE